MKKPVVLLDVTNLSLLRKDGHPSMYGLGGPTGMDCSHWCLAGVPDTWNEILYNLILWALIYGWIALRNWTIFGGKNWIRLSFPWHLVNNNKSFGLPQFFIVSWVSHLGLFGSWEKEGSKGNMVKISNVFLVYSKEKGKKIL